MEGETCERWPKLYTGGKATSSGKARHHTVVWHGYAIDNTGLHFELFFLKILIWHVQFYSIHAWVQMSQNMLNGCCWQECNLLRTRRISCFQVSFSWEFVGVKIASSPLSRGAWWSISIWAAFRKKKKGDPPLHHNKVKVVLFKHQNNWNAICWLFTMWHQPCKSFLLQDE